MREAYTISFRASKQQAAYTRVLRALYLLKTGYLPAPQENKSGLLKWGFGSEPFLWVDVKKVGKAAWDNVAYSHHCKTRDGALIVYEIKRCDDDHAPI